MSAEPTGVDGGGETEETVELGDHERQLIASIAESPAWESLRKVARNRMERHFRRLAHTFAMKGVEPNYAELQWQRGVIAGMKFILDNPLIEAAKLERLLAEQQEEGSEPVA